MSGPEAKFQKRVIRYLKDKGCYVLNVPGSAQIPAGTPDILFCAPGGLFYALELKVKGNHPSELQLRAIDQINKAGGNARVLYDYEWEGFISEFEDMVER